MKTYRILSLGAGVQSTALYLMAMKGEIEPIDAAIFADTQEESAEVYRHLEWMKSLGGPRIYVGTKGKLGDDLLAKRPSGRELANIPFFVQSNGKIGMIHTRQCTGDYKIKVIDRVYRREIVGNAPRQRMPKGVQLQQIIGISLDESARAFRILTRHRNSGRKWELEPSFPLVDKLMTRAMCIDFLEKNCPHEAPRSACIFCPYQNNAEWRCRKDDPASWARIVAVDLSIRNGAAGSRMKGELFLHRDCKPITEVDFGKAEDGREKDIQTNLGFWKECLGMCGN